MSNFLNFAGNQGTTFKNHGTGGGTSFTLDVNASTNSVLLTVGGVLQAPGTDYTVSGTTITTTSSVTAGIEVLSWVLHKQGTAPVIQDNSVDGTKLAITGQTQGDLMYYNGTDWVRIAAGTSSQLLYGGTAPAFGAAPQGSSLTFISSTTVSGSPPSVNFSNIDTHMGTYDELLWTFSKFGRPSTSTQIQWKVSTDGGSTFVNQNYAASMYTESGTTYTAASTSDTAPRIGPDAFYVTAGSVDGYIRMDCTSGTAVGYYGFTAHHSATPKSGVSYQSFSGSATANYVSIATASGTLGGGTVRLHGVTYPT